MTKYLVGVDEVGRGPLAGPVGVGVVLVPVDFDWSQILGVTDSKKLTEKRREEIYVQAVALRKAGKLDFAVSLVSAKVIDRIGIVPAITKAMGRSLKKITEASALYHVIDVHPENCAVKLDGGLRAPTQYALQETVVKGDGKEKVIGLASIVAKVMRDRYMVRKQTVSCFAPYAFATHKGYGTKIHRAAIATHGFSAEHRQTFCKNIKIKSNNKVI